MAEQQQTYTIPAQNMPRLEERIAELAKRAKRLKTSPIGLTILSTERMEREDGRVDIVYKVQVVGKAPKINGWTFVATLEHTSIEGEPHTIIRTVPGQSQEGEMVAYRQALPVCDHCRQNRARNDTYLLRRDSDGEIKQVGRTCLRDFLGHDSPESLVALAEILALCGEACEGAVDDLDAWGMGGGRAVLDLEYYLYWVHATIRECGWVSATKSRETDEAATSALALFALQDYSQKPWQAIQPPTQGDKDITKQALAWIREGDWNTLNDYLYNLYVTCKGIVITHRQLGLAASLFAAYDKAMETEREQKQAAATSQWQGEVGKRQVFTLTCNSVHYSEGMYGMTAIYRLTDVAGNVFTWFSSCDVLETGATYQLKGTVKDHGDYKGVKQTIITRCAVMQEVASAA